jgi:hypothetical protein
VNLEDYRTLFFVATLGLTLLAASPALSWVVPLQGGSEEFSELWLLGPDHMAEGYPLNVGAGDVYSVFVGVNNHMCCSEYYAVYAKFRNQTQPLPDINYSQPSSLSPLYEFRFLLADGKTWESPLAFAFQGVSVESDSVFVDSVTINGVAFPINSFSTWDSENSGFYFQLFFELWRYDRASQDFRFDNRFVGIWLNMTGS